MRANRLIPPFLIALLFTIGTFAQTSGRISGSVTDNSGAVIGGAVVQLLLDGTVVATTTTTATGLFTFAGLRPATYALTVSMDGFNKTTLNNVKADTARETTLPAIPLEVAAVQQSVEVSAAVASVQTSNAEVSTTVLNEQVRLLPQLNRNILALVSTQAGVGSNLRTNTTVNGMKVSYANVTIDGINIQDNLFRENGLDFQPNLLLIDQVGEVTISTSNTNASVGGGASQIAFSTPSGTNKFGGSLYWYNRNNYLAANGWFENRDGIPLAPLNQNQAGGSSRGPILKNKLFFYANYEAFRRRQQAAQNRTILTESARNGVFTYEDTAGNLRQVNILQAMQKSIDPNIRDLIGQLPAASAINNFRVGDSREGLLRNTGGYSFLQRSNRDRDNVTGRVDYVLSDRHSVFGTYLWNQDFTDRPTVSALGYTQVPSVNNDNATNLASIGWRGTFSPTFTNELRGGFNIAPGYFTKTVPDAPFYLTSLVFTNPVQTYMPEGRDTTTWNINNNANWVKGRHTLSFGFQAQNINVNSFDYFSLVPSYAIGLSPGVAGLTAAQLPGVRANDLIAANNLYATLAGIITSGTQRFNVADRTSGFKPGAENRRIWNLGTYAGYLQDNWRINRKLSLSMGVRYDYFTVVDEERALSLLPVVPEGGNIIGTLRSNATLDFAGKAVGRGWYNPDRNNFAPNLAIAYDPFGNGKLAIRAGYSVSFVNDNHIATMQNGPRTNQGLASDVTLANLNATASARPAIPTPTFRVPRTAADNFALNPTSAIGAFDPNLRTPYVQQWNLSVQKELAGGVLEARYIGNRGTKQFRAFDYNQIDINAGGFLPDFRRAYSNGVIALNASGVFDARYNPALAGSQPTPVFDSLPSGGLLTNATVRNLIQTQAAGELARIYQENGLNGSINFFPNPVAQGTNMLTNFSRSSYDAFQIDYTRRFARGFSFQVNYAFAKSLSDQSGISQVNFEPFLDINNAKLEKSPTPFDLRHAFKSNGVYELPFGKGKKWLNASNGVVSRLVSAWSLSGIMTLQSGSPFSINSLRGTFNRAGRSTNNTAVTSLTSDQLDDIVGLYMTGNGPFLIAASAVGQDGRGVASDGRAPFTGQVFFNPTAGNVGTLQRRMFYGPRYFNFDFGIVKSTQVFEGHTLEFRMESTNVLNNNFFYTADIDINAPTFSRVTQTNSTPRRIQFGLYYRF